MKITNIDDYVNAVQEVFPEFTKNEIKRILVYGWKMILQYVNAGNDFSIITPRDFFFIGKIPSEPLQVYKKYHKQLAKRIAFMFKRTKSEWDGYYYFTLRENQYKDYLLQSRRKNKIFKNIFIYKILDEAKLMNPTNLYVFRTQDDNIKNRMRRFYSEIKLKDAELIEVRDSLKMENILTSYNKYKYIQ